MKKYIPPLCEYCDKPIKKTDKQITISHVHEGASFPYNGQPLHLRCNKKAMAEFFNENKGAYAQ